MKKKKQWFINLCYKYRLHAAWHYWFWVRINVINLPAFILNCRFSTTVTWWVCKYVGGQTTQTIFMSHVHSKYHSTSYHTGASLWVYKIPEEEVKTMINFENMIYFCYVNRFSMQLCSKRTSQPIHIHANVQLVNHPSHQDVFPLKHSTHSSILPLLRA